MNIHEAMYKDSLAYLHAKSTAEKVFIENVRENYESYLEFKKSLSKVLNPDSKLDKYKTMNKEQIKQEIMGEVERLIEDRLEKTKQESKRWPQTRDQYWYIDDHCCVGRLKWEDDEIDQCGYSLGNVYKTREEAKRALDKRLLIEEIKKKAEELNEGWKPDWNDSYEEKFGLYYFYSLNEWKIDSRFSVQYLSTLPALRDHRVGHQLLTHFGDRLNILLED